MDINLGCPQRIARRGHYGAFLLDHPEEMNALGKILHGSCYDVMTILRMGMEMVKVMGVKSL